MNTLADSIKRLREVLQARYKMTNLTTQDVAHVEFQSAVHFPEAIQTINQLVELVAEMATGVHVNKKNIDDGVRWAGDFHTMEHYTSANYCRKILVDTLTKADALLTGLKE